MFIKSINRLCHPYIVMNKAGCVYFCVIIYKLKVFEKATHISALHAMTFDLNDIDIWNREHLSVIMTSQ